MKLSNAGTILESLDLISIDYRFDRFDEDLFVDAR